MKITKKIQLNGGQTQILDLNDGSVNFSSDVRLASSNPFQLCITTQEHFDNSGDLDFKQVDNTLEVTVKSDNNILKNFIMVFKSTKDCNIVVDIDKTELPTKMVQPPPQLIPPSQPQSQIHNTQSTSKLNYKFILIGLIVVIIVGISIYMFFKDETKKITKGEILRKSFKTIKSPSPSPDTFPSPSSSDSSPSTESSDYSPSPNSDASTPDTGASDTD